MKFFSYVPALYAIYSHVEALVSTAKADDGVVDKEEAYSIALGSLTAISRILFPQLDAEQQDHIEQALFGLGKVRDRVAYGYNRASTALTKADQAYSDITNTIS